MLNYIKIIFNLFFLKRVFFIINQKLTFFIYNYLFKFIFYTLIKQKNNLNGIIQINNFKLFIFISFY